MAIQLWPIGPDERGWGRVEGISCLEISSRKVGERIEEGKSKTGEYLWEVQGRLSKTAVARGMNG